jgi:hypothetical protein
MNIDRTRHMKNQAKSKKKINILDLLKNSNIILRQNIKDLFLNFIFI